MVADNLSLLRPPTKDEQNPKNLKKTQKKQKKTKKEKNKNGKQKNSPGTVNQCFPFLGGTGLVAP